MGSVHCKKMPKIAADGTAFSGERSDAVPAVRSLVEQAGDRILVMPGCGIRPWNILDIARGTGARELHIALNERVESGMSYRKSGIPMGGIEDREFVTFTTPERSVRGVIEQLQMGFAL